MSAESDPRAWVGRAEEDYVTPQLLLRRKQLLTSIICFHAQRRAEKYLKGMLVFKGESFAKTHDLILLNQQCEAAGILVGMEPRRLNDLSDYAVRARYPGDDPTPDEAREALKITRAVRKFARRYLGLA